MHRSRLALLPLLLIGCGPEIQIIRYEAAVTATAQPASCAAPIYGESDAVPDDCEAVGDVFIGDSAWTLGCDAEEMVGHLREQTCTSGADAAHIIRISAPAGGSSCHQVRARLLRCAVRSAESPA